MSLTLEEILAAFAAQKSTYEAFTAFCQTEIEEFLREKRIWYQVVQSRTKSEASLSRKFKSEGVKVQKLSAIRDLSGVRVITYLDSEIEKVYGNIWLNDRIGRLKVVKRVTRYRDPAFFGLFLILELDDSNAEGLPSEFEGLKCELQLTTVFQHGWAEVYHHSIRSRREDIEDLSLQALESIDRKYEELVKGPLRQASDQLHFLNSQAAELLKGVEYKAENPIRLIRKASNLNEMMDLLNKAEDAIDNFGGRLPDLFSSLPELAACRSLLESLPCLPRLIGDFETEGSSKDDCFHKLLTLARKLGFTDIPSVIQFFTTCWREEVSERSECEAQLKEFLRWDLKALGRWGYTAHLDISAQLDSMFKQFDDELTRFFIIAAEQLLAFHVDGTWETGPNTFAISLAAVRVDEDLVSIRAKAFFWLLKIAHVSEHEELRLYALRAIFNALHCPSLPSEVEPKLKELLAAESDEVLKSILAGIDARTFPELREILDGTKDLIFWHERQGVVAVAAQRLRVAVEVHPRIVRFRDLIGKVEFTGDHEDYEARKQERIAKGRSIGSLAASSNWEDWKRLIFEASSFQQQIGFEQFESFQAFLEALAENSPERALELIKEEIGSLGRFVSSIIRVLLSEGDIAVRPVLLSHLKDGRSPLDIAYGLVNAKTVEPDYVFECVEAIDLSSHPEAVGILIQHLLERTDLTDDGRERVVAYIEKLADRQDYSWFRIFFLERATALRKLSRDQWARILSSLRSYRRLDHSIEEILLGAIQVDVTLILDFLIERIELGRSRQNAKELFFSTPRDMRRLYAVLREHPEEVSRRLKAEFLNADAVGRQSYVGPLLSELVPLDSTEMSGWLGSLADSDLSSDHDLLLEILNPYGNTIKAHEFYKRLIRNTRFDRRDWPRIAGRLLRVESYVGDDGKLLQVQGYAANVSTWADENSRINDFKEFFADIARTEIEGENERLSRERTNRLLDYEFRTGKTAKTN